MKDIHKTKQLFNKAVQQRCCIVCKFNYNNFTNDSKCNDCIDLINNDKEFLKFGYVPRFEPINYKKFIDK